MRCAGLTAVGFDLGDTLVEYEGVPLSWEAHYRDALLALGRQHVQPISDDDLERGAAVLRRFNTRLTPRTHEVRFGEILAGVSDALQWAQHGDELAAARAFFEVFRRRLRPFPDAAPSLAGLRAAGIRVGLLTDVPYGMPRSLVLEDVAAAGLADAFDTILTSGDVGARKPASEPLAALATGLGATAETFVYVGNERKDIESGRAFGCRTILLDRANATPAWQQDFTIHSLTEIVAAP